MQHVRDRGMQWLRWSATASAVDVIAACGLGGRGQGQQPTRRGIRKPDQRDVYAQREASVYFDWRLFGMSRGVRGRIAVAALIGLAAVPLSMWRLTLTGQAMARAFAGERFEALFGMLALIASLIVAR